MTNIPTKRYCAFCGLPLPAALSWGAPSETDVAEYCCSGCRSVASVLAAKQEEGVAANAMLRLGLAIFFTMNVMVFTMALWSEDVYPANSFANPLAETLRSVFRWASLVFSLPVLYLVGGPIARGVWQSLQRRVLTTDLLILAGVIAAYCYSIVSVLRGVGHVYFEIGAMVMVFVSIGRWLEAKGKHRAGTSLDRLVQILPEMARKQHSDGQFVEAPTSELRTGDVVRILSGERFPVDGVIVRGQATLDEQIVTGESVPATKLRGDIVYSGTLNLDGDLWVEVTAADGKETLSRIVEMVRAARSAKGRHERLADRIALVFIPLVSTIALAAGWWHYRHGGLNQGILTTLSVVLIACPCALGMATPMAIWAALGRAAQGGLLFRSGVVLERLAEIRFACFDKTGTLTTGSPVVADFHRSILCDRKTVLRVANTLASGSSHLLSQAISAYAAREGCGRLLPSAPVIISPGQGVSTEVEEIGAAYLGSRRYLAESGLGLPVDLEKDGIDTQLQQEVCVGWSGLIRGVFQFKETLRPEAALALAECRRLGLKMRLLSGDNQLRTLPFGDQLGVESAGNLLPAEKAVTLESLKARGPVAMVGDGLNDAPALATADVGVALGCGADVSRDAAGVCLLSDDLRRFPWSVALARQTVRIVKQNLFWAFAYNIVGIGLAACGRLNPILAALAMALSSVFVIFNSLRLSSFPEPAPSESVDRIVGSWKGEEFPTRAEIAAPELVGAES